MIIYIFNLYVVLVLYYELYHLFFHIFLNILIYQFKPCFNICLEFKLYDRKNRNAKKLV